MPLHLARSLSLSLLASSLGCGARAPEPAAPATAEGSARALGACLADLQPLPKPADDLQRRAIDLVDRCQGILVDEHSSCKAVRTCSGVIEKMHAVACKKAGEDSSWVSLCADFAWRQSTVEACVSSACPGVTEG